jgi:hypothetical protein
MRHLVDLSWASGFTVGVFVFSLLASTTLAQLSDGSSEGVSRPIEDNSFLIEEAYNQEKGVVQHISNLMHSFTPERDLTYSFTQEWPLFGQSHQLSFTIPSRLHSTDNDGGVGDILINYRYQLFNRDDWAAVALRLSMILPTGNKNAGLGSGVVGVQVNLPASKRLSESFVAHANAGFTLLPRVRQALDAGDEVKNDLTAYNVGASLIWLIATNYNLLCEYVTNFSADVRSDGTKTRSVETIVSPGFRYAIDVGSLQIVPGIAIPVTFVKSDVQAGAFVYLSFEHPF